MSEQRAAKRARPIVDRGDGGDGSDQEEGAVEEKGEGEETEEVPAALEAARMCSAVADARYESARRAHEEADAVRRLNRDSVKKARKALKRARKMHEEALARAEELLQRSELAKERTAKELSDAVKSKAAASICLQKVERSCLQDDASNDDIEAAAFVSPSRSEIDQAKMCDFYGAPGLYMGELDADGRMEGNGVMRYDNRDEYEGMWEGGRFEGLGTIRWADNGEIYQGEFKKGKRHGKGTYWYGDGRAEISRCRANRDVGLGAGWSADRQTAYRLENGVKVADITLPEAAKIAEGLGLPVPSVSGATSQVMDNASTYLFNFSRSNI